MPPVDLVEQRIPAGHPIRGIKRLADEAIRLMDETNDGTRDDSATASPLGPLDTQRILKADLLAALYAVPSDHQFCERVAYDLLFRFFLDMNLDDSRWDATSLAKGRGHLLRTPTARTFIPELLRQAKAANLLSAGHFCLDENIESLLQATTDGTASTDRAISEPLRIINERMRERLSVSAVAKEARVSRRVMERRFQSTMGITPLDYIRRTRVSEAKKLLLASPQVSLKDVAKQCGFTETRRMNDAFKQIEGVTPQMYRRRRWQRHEGASTQLSAPAFTGRA